MKKETKISMKGVMLILSMMTFGLLLQNCDNQSVVDDELSSDLALKKHSVMLPDGITPPDACKTVCLVAGQYMYTGTVDVASSINGDVYVTYNITEPNIYLMEIHLDIFDSEEDFKDQKKISNGGAIPGKFTFKKSWDEEDMKTSFTVMIPAAYVDDLESEDDCYFIASHAALSNGETAWGGLCDETDKGVSLNNALQFPGKNWSVYFEYCMEECDNSINFTYAWEDINNDKVPSQSNDGDYNDLVIKSDVVKTPETLVINFKAVARGAGFNHAFKIKVPQNGIVGGMTGIFGEDPVDAVEDDGNGNYIITVFPSTRSVLPGEDIAPHEFAANTAPDDATCTPNGNATITIVIDGDFDYDPAFPYDPFITVTPFSGSADKYDLNIWELHRSSGEGDVWTAGDLVFPNGIIINSDWQWPYERVNINLAYPNFSDTAAWDANWANSAPNAGTFFELDCW